MGVTAAISRQCFGRCHDGKIWRRRRRCAVQYARYLYAADRTSVAAGEDAILSQACTHMYFTLAACRADDGKHRVVVRASSRLTITGQLLTLRRRWRNPRCSRCLSIAVEWGPVVAHVRYRPCAFPRPSMSGHSADAAIKAGRNATPRPRRRHANLLICELSDFRPGRLHQWRDGGAGWRRAFAQFRRRDLLQWTDASGRNSATPPKLLN